MDKTMLHRITEARNYGKLAVKALLPEQAAGHLDIIEREIKAMITECVIDMLKQEEEGSKQEDKNTSEKIKKVNID